MAKEDRDVVDYGEPLTYDKSFKGPLAKRSCTDVICLLIFLVFLSAWGFLSYFAFKHGDLNKLLVPTDSQNRKCGVDNQVLDKKYLFFFNLQQCIDPIVTISGCPTPQTCVRECPKETFVFDTYDKKSSIADLKSKLICLDDTEKEKIQSRDDARRLIEQNKCARWYVKSRPFLNRCVWEFSSSVCEYIPSHLIDRDKRDIPLPKNSSANFEESSNLLRIDANLEPPFTAVTVGHPQNEMFTDGDTFSVETFKVYNQQKLPEEPRVQCKIRQQLGEEVIMKKMKRTDTYLGRFIGNIVAHFYNGPDAQEFGQKVVEDIINSWITIFVALIAAMVVSLVFIAIMRWIAAPVVWFSIIGVLAGIGYGIYITSIQYIYWRDNPTVPQHSPNLAAKVKTWFQDKNAWLGLDIALAVIFLILFLVIVFLRDRIVIAIALVKEGSKAVGTIISAVFFPILPWVLQVATIGFAVIVGLYLASIGESSFKVVGPLAEKCVCSNAAKDYKTGGSCIPEVFNANCFQKGNLGKCTEVGCFFEKLQSPTIIGYLHAYNVIGFFWLMFFISAFGEMVLAATFATWYWTFHKSDVPFFTLTRAFLRTIRYHLGTLAFGSLIITICRIIRVILEFIDAQLKKYDNPFTRAILCCMKCFFWCLENFLRFLNKNAYIMCAIHGKNFCSSAKDAFNLLMRNVLRVVIVDKVTDFLFFLSKLLITSAVGAATYFYVDGFPEQHKLHYNWVPTAIVVVGTYLITTVFFGVYSMAVDTLFLCFLEDSERNDGSAEKPYYMSKHLMKILGNRNEIPRHQYR